MDVDHEAHRHGTPPSTLEGEAERTAAAEDRSDQTKAVLDDAKAIVEGESEPTGDRDPPACAGAERDD